jgi:hypothetical protein
MASEFCFLNSSEAADFGLRLSLFFDHCGGDFPLLSDLVTLKETDLLSALDETSLLLNLIEISGLRVLMFVASTTEALLVQLVVDLVVPVRERKVLR